MFNPAISMETLYKNIEVAGVPGLVFTVIEDRQKECPRRENP